MPDEHFTVEHLVSPGGCEITVCRPVLPDDERERRMELTCRKLCELYEAWCKSGVQDPAPEE